MCNCTVGESSQPDISTAETGADGCRPLEVAIALENIRSKTSQDKNRPNALEDNRTSKPLITLNSSAQLISNTILLQMLYNNVSVISACA